MQLAECGEQISIEFDVIDATRPLMSIFERDRERECDTPTRVMDERLKWRGEMAVRYISESGVREKSLILRGLLGNLEGGQWGRKKGSPSTVWRV